jgi:TldD protein
MAVATTEAYVGDDRHATSLQVSVSCCRGPHVAHGRASSAWRLGLDALPPERAVTAAAALAVTRAVDRLSALASPIPASARYAVVFGPATSAGVVCLLAANLLAGDAIVSGISPFARDSGRLIASPRFTLLDDGTALGQFGSIRFDDEGVRSQRTTLIEHGVLVGALLDRAAARSLGRSSTGNGRRESYAHVPIPQATNIVVLPGSESQADLIGSVRNGLYVNAVGNGQIDVTTGRFVVAASGFRIAAGELTQPVAGTMIGEARHVLANMSGFSREVGGEWSPLVGGKSSQSIPCGVVGPAVRVDAGITFAPGDDWVAHQSRPA